MKWIKIVEKFPYLFIVALTLLTLFFGYRIKDIKVDVDIIHSLPQSIPAKKLYDKMNEIFPSKEIILVAVESRKGSIFKPEIIKKVWDLTNQLEEIKDLYKVISPTNVDIIEATPDGMEIHPILSHVPVTKKEIEKFKKKLNDSPLASGNLVSRDQRAFGIMLMLKKDADSKAVSKKVIDIYKHYIDSEVNISATGKPIINYYLSIGVGRDMGMLFSIALIVIILLLFFTFRSFRGVILPLWVVISSVTWTLGTMAILGFPMSHSTEMMPILLMSIGVADSIHILKYYYRFSMRYRQPTTLVNEVFKELFSPVTMTSLTTMAGFIALNTSRTESLAELGYFTAYGVLVAWIYSVTFLPAVLSILKPPRSPDKVGFFQRVIDSLMDRYSTSILNYRRPMLWGIVILIIISGLGASRLKFEQSSIEEFPADHPLRIADRIINEHFAGSTTFDIMFEGKEKDVILDPAVLKAIDNIEQYALKLKHVGGAQSLADFIKLMNRVMHDNDPSYYRIPGEKEKITDFDENGNPVTIEVNGKDLIAQYLALYEMSARPDDFAHLVDLNYRNARLILFINSDKNTILKPIDRAITRKVKEETRGLPINAEITGIAKLMMVVNDLVVKGQAISLLTSLFLIWLLTTIMFRSGVVGFFNTIPLIISQLINFGIMGYFSIPVQIVTMVTTSVAIGVGVDYAIHYVHNFRWQLAKGLNYEDAMKESIREAGSPIILNALTVGLGFLVLVFSSFKGVSNMGLLIGLTMFTTSIGALTILPVIFITAKPKSLLKSAEVIKDEVSEE